MNNLEAKEAVEKALEIIKPTADYVDAQPAEHGDAVIFIAGIGDGGNGVHNHVHISGAPDNIVISLFKVMDKAPLLVEVFKAAVMLYESENCQCPACTAAREQKTNPNLNA